MKIVRDSNAQTFLENSRAMLYEREDENGLLIGLAESLTTYLQPGIEPAFFRAEENGRTQAVLLQTRVQNVVMSRATEAQAIAFAKAARDAGLITRGVSGPLETGETFCRHYFDNRPYEILQNNKILALTKVIPPARPAAGSLRLAEDKDFATVLRFLEGFLPEALPKEPPPPREETAKLAKDKLNRRTVYLWEDEHGVPVSTAHSTRPTANGICIAAVYTPPSLRGKGYASSMMAALSQRLLDEGRKFCVLYTDAENPTSNKVYEAIGYRVIGSAAMVGIRAQS